MPSILERRLSMATLDFDSSGFDDLIESLQHFEIDCPECNQSFEITLDDIGNTVSCPHCHTQIKLESE